MDCRKNAVRGGAEVIFGVPSMANAQGGRVFRYGLFLEGWWIGRGEKEEARKRRLRFLADIRGRGRGGVEGFDTGRQRE